VSVYLRLIYEFIKTGMFAVGGGYATLPFLNAMADKYPWFTRELLTGMIAVSESTPGPIGINMATYAGYSAAGVGGGVAASLALILPSVVIVAAAARFLASFNDNRFVKAAFTGLRPAVTALIAYAGLTVAAITLVDVNRWPELTGLFNYKQLILFVIFFTVTRIYKKMQPYQMILAAAVAGVILKI
jgi:chromate transporter